MAGHRMFHDATVKFTEDFINSLPRKLTEYKHIILSTFKLSLDECADDGYSCSGTIQNLARFTEDFLRHVSEEEKKAISKMGTDENCRKKKRRLLSISMPCPVCEFTTREVVAYRNHIKVHKADVSMTEQLRFNCHLCKDKSFQTKDVSTYLRHIRSVHIKLKPVLCELCGLSFKRADSLRNHQATIHGPGANKSHQCEICNKKFLRKAHLLDHYQIHNRPQEVCCEICKAKFKSQKAKDRHILYKHTNPGSFKCDKCQKRFNTKDNLRSHMKRHEKENVVDTEVELSAVKQKVAEHIQSEIESKSTAQESADDASLNAGDQSQSVAASAAPSPAARDADMEVAAIHPAAPAMQLELEKQVDEAMLVVHPPAFPSRPVSVNSQYNQYNESQSHNEDKDLDEIFPEPVHDEPEVAYVSKVPQEELDSVFRKDVIRPDPHSQLSRPGSVSSHHTESLPTNDALDSLLPMTYRPIVSTESAVASPQSVCSSQFAHQSRPPSATSQHSAYHDPNSMVVPPYMQSQAYVIPPPNIVFSSPMSCTNDIVNIQPMAAGYDKPVSCILTPNHQTLSYMTHTSGATPTDHLIGVASSFNSHLAQPSALANQYGASVHYTSTASPQECITIQSTTRCVTPQNFPITPTFRQQTVDGRPIDVFANLAGGSDTLLLPPTGANNDIVPELLTPNKTFPDNESVVADFSNILAYSSPS